MKTFDFPSILSSTALTASHRATVARTVSVETEASQRTIPRPLSDGKNDVCLNIPVAVSYSKEDPSLIGSLKADILAIRGKINDIRGKPDAETSELIMKIAKHVSSEDAQQELQSRLFLLEVRDYEMHLLEALLQSRMGNLCPEPPRSASSPTFSPTLGLRVQSFLTTVDLVVSLSSQSQAKQQMRDREGRNLMEAYLRAQVTAQTDQLKVIRKEANAEHDRMEADIWAACVERDAAKASLQQLRQSLAAADEANGKMKQELEWFRRDQQRLRRETSFLNSEIRTLSSKPTEAPRAAPPVEFEGCDKCPGLDARCNRLLQEQEEMKYILLTTRQEQNRQFLESKDTRRKLELEKERSQELATELGLLGEQHRQALVAQDRHGHLLARLRNCFDALVRGHLLQVEAGERLAIVAAEALHLKVSCEGSAAGSTPSSGAPSPRGPRLPEMEVIVMLTPRSQAELEDRSSQCTPSLQDLLCPSETEILKKEELFKDLVISAPWVSVAASPRSRPLRHRAYRQCIACQATKDSEAYMSGTWTCKSCLACGQPSIKTHHTMIYTRCLVCHGVKDKAQFPANSWTCGECTGPRTPRTVSPRLAAPPPPP